MNRWLQQQLRCPFCAGSLSTALDVESAGGALEYGIIACADCRCEFAVVEGIPILAAPNSTLDVKLETTDDTLLKGPALSTVIDALRRRDCLSAFSLLLNPIGRIATKWRLQLRPPAEDSRVTHLIREGAGASTSQPSAANETLRPLRSAYGWLRLRYKDHVLPRWREALARYLREYRDRLYAIEVIDAYYREYSCNEVMHSYFAYRLGQPRHLAALSVASLLRTSSGALLDIACGAGHLTHYLSYGRDRKNVVGIDRDFFCLFVAKKFVAPQAQFLCMSVDGVLPFDDETFAGVLCSDAFHYFRFKQASIREFQRVVANQGTMVLTRVGNRTVEPNEGYELDLAGYRKLLAAVPHTVLTETGLLERYLKKLGPDLSVDHTHTGGVSESKWLTFVASRKEGVFTERGAFDHWPHAIGRLGVNPIYVPTGEDDRGLALQFTFPSQWYALEDAAYRQYAPDVCVLPPGVLKLLRTGEGTADLDEHLRRMAIIGMPDRYIRPL